jgi:monothiol glutaredoxin
MPNDLIRQEIEREVAANTILVYGKGTKNKPLCGFTRETIAFFNYFGYPFEVIDVLDHDLKREELSQVTGWTTLPKVFIGGHFYGDTDILEPMAESGELQTVLAEAFAGKAEPVPVIRVH